VQSHCSLKSEDFEKILIFFFAFCGKTIVPKVYIVTLINVMCSISRNLADGKSAVVRYLPDKKKQNFAWLSSSHCCMDCAQNLPGPAVDNVLRVLQISSKSVHFWRSYTGMREHHQNGRKVFPVFG